MCLPSDLCTEAQSEQIRTPLFTEAQLGELDPQSAHTERGWRGLDLLNMVVVTYRLFKNIIITCTREGCFKQLTHKPYEAFSTVGFFN